MEGDTAVCVFTYPFGLLPSHLTDQQKPFFILAFFCVKFSVYKWSLINLNV